jgi:hypothetical protein
MTFALSRWARAKLQLLKFLRGASAAIAAPLSSDELPSSHLSRATAAMENMNDDSVRKPLGFGRGLDPSRGHLPSVIYARGGVIPARFPKH